LSGAWAPPDDWDRHWDDYADAGRLNPAQRYRRRLIMSLLGDVPAGARVVDIGSGQGDLAWDVRNQFPGPQILGLELSKSGCEISRRKVPDATFVQCNLLEAQHTPDEFRAWATHAVCSEVLEHVDDPGILLSKALGYLAPGCRLVVTVPGGPKSAFDLHIGHRRHYTPDALRELLAGVGFEVRRSFAAGFPFHNLYRLAVIARGHKLVDDVAAGEDQAASGAARLAMQVFTPLFALNLTSSPWGWQIVATAEVPA
jgi:SAM-dependent methyltransferase